MHFFKKDRDLWDNLARNYSEVVHSSSKSYNWYHQELVPRILRSVLSQKTVLDFGCGDGTIANQISQQGSEVTGLDISPKMIALGKEKFPNLDLRVCDILKEEKKEKSFDSIVANMVLHDIKDFTNVVRNLTQLLKENGIFVFSIPHPCFYNELGRKYFDGTHQMVQIQRYKSPHSFTKFNDGKHMAVRHYHRRLTEYFKVFFELGYYVESFEEIFEKHKNAEVPFAILFIFKKQTIAPFPSK